MSTKANSLHCPDCGSPLSSEAWGENLCLVCLLRLAAAPIDSDAARTTPHVALVPDGAATAVEIGTAPLPAAPGSAEAFRFERGEVLADRYRVLKRLGRGGMGEVWRAYDLKLRVDVALKSLNAALAGAEGLELMRGEVRTAREVVSPNVCRIFDLIEVDGHELVSMEFVDGHTLLRVLDERGPLEVQEAAEIGAQLLAGLEAIHAAGLVHRDIKPENIMLTRARRVVIMDFGLTARKGEGLHAGTPAYMAPEQRRGEGTDARADVFSAGVVLAEMLSAGGEDAAHIRQLLWEAVREDPPALPQIPWRRALLKAVAADRDDRYPSAAAMARTLESVAARVANAEQMTPYPGLAAYASDGAEFFFGREAEVESLWKKLQHAHLLGLIGASGAGKSSFVQAGLLPARPRGWAHLQFKPGRAPFAALARALAPASGGDKASLGAGGMADDPQRLFAAVEAWRRQHREVLLVVDQFEELFTQSEPSVRMAFADLLARLAFEADVHVLLSMRDDFLMRCYDLPALAPIFSELTPLRPPFGSALRRAIVQPALKCGYRFETEAIVEDMLAEVTRERAALPLIAFTAARLWEGRDQDTGLLTQEVYDRLGGVAGALAQHAETTLEAIGSERIPIVRELFRNLVTAQGTRATVDVEELLSIFDDDDRHAAAAETLQALIDARLLTSYEVRVRDDEEPQRRVEVVHESLLSAWPRLVRWQSQDADSLQLRDELRQASKLWDARGRSADLLWTGTAYREFRLWRDRYPGRLTTLEESFARAMVDTAERSRRRRQRFIGGTFAALLLVVAGVTTLWRQSELARLRAEAQTMVVQGTQGVLESYPTGALAWAIRSLEVADTPGGRLLALQALWKGPPAWRVNDTPGLTAQFSADGRSLLQSTRRTATGSLLSLIRADGTSSPIDGGHDIDRVAAFWSAADADRFVTIAQNAEGIEYGVGSASQGASLGIVTLPLVSDFLLKWNAALGGLLHLDDGGAARLATLDGQPPRSLGQLPGPAPRDVAPDASWIAQVVDGRVEIVPVGADGLGSPRTIGRHPGATAIGVAAAAGLVATRDDGGELRFWPLDAAGANRPADLPLTVAGPPGPGGGLGFSHDGSLLTFGVSGPGDAEGLAVWVASLKDGRPRLRPLGAPELSSSPIRDGVRNQVMLPTGGSMLWHRLGAPDGTRGLMLQSGMLRSVYYPSFHPNGDWVAAVQNSLTVWSLAHPYPMVIPAGGQVLRFLPDGSEFLAISPNAAGEAGIYSWPLEGEMPESRRLISARTGVMQLSPDGDTVALGGRPDDRTSPLLLRRDDGSERLLPNGFVDQMNDVSFSPDGRLLAGVGGQFIETENVIRVWDLATGDLVAEHDPEGLLWYYAVPFVGDRRIAWAGESGTYLWDLDLDEHRLLDPRTFMFMQADRLGRRLVGKQTDSGVLTSIDLSTGAAIDLTAFGSDVRRFTLSADGEVLATVDLDGLVRVGRPTDAEPHLLFSHVGEPRSIAIDPRGRWVATTSDEEIRLWPMPDLSAPPLHTLPYEQLLATLRSLTNVRLVEDPENADGWGLTFEPFPGWDFTPTW